MARGMRYLASSIDDESPRRHSSRPRFRSQELDGCPACSPVAMLTAYIDPCPHDESIAGKAGLTTRNRSRMHHGGTAVGEYSAHAGALFTECTHSPASVSVARCRAMLEVGERPPKGQAESVRTSILVSRQPMRLNTHSVMNSASRYYQYQHYPHRNSGTCQDVRRQAIMHTHVCVRFNARDRE